MLSVDIDESRLTAVAREFSASEEQIRFAFNRALRRTAGTIRKLTVSGLRTELGLRNAKLLRRRIKMIQRRGANRMSMKLWVGSNPVSYSHFKGRVKKTPTGVQVGSDVIHGAFLSSANGASRKQIFKRRGRARLPIDAQKKDIHDQVVIFLESNVFIDLQAIFFKNFIHEIKARTIYGVGKS